MEASREVEHTTGAKFTANRYRADDPAVNENHVRCIASIDAVEGMHHAVTTAVRVRREDGAVPSRAAVRVRITVGSSVDLSSVIGQHQARVGMRPFGST